MVRLPSAIPPQLIRLVCFQGAPLGGIIESWPTTARSPDASIQLWVFDRYLNQLEYLLPSSLPPPISPLPTTSKTHFIGWWPGQVSAYVMRFQLYAHLKAWNISAVSNYTSCHQLYFLSPTILAALKPSSSILYGFVMQGMKKKMQSNMDTCVPPSVPDNIINFCRVSATIFICFEARSI